MLPLQRSKSKLSQFGIAAVFIPCVQVLHTSVRANNRARASTSANASNRERATARASTSGIARARASASFRERAGERLFGSVSLPH